MSSQLSRLLPPLLLAALTAAQIAPEQFGPREIVGSGLSLRRAEAVDGNGLAQCVTVLEADPRVEGVRFELALARGLEPTSLLANRGGATAAVNGGFFTKGGLPDGLFRQGGQQVSPASAARGAALVLDNDGSMSLQRDSAGRFAGASSVLTAGPMLLVQGQPPAERQWSNARHPRSAIGIDAAGVVLLVAVDGRSARASGMTLDELAESMRALGCRDALNLDGGGSTTLWLLGTPGNGVINHPCDNKVFDSMGERAVANALLVFADAAAVEPAVDVSERARRTARDFDRSREQIVQQLHRRVRDFRAEELDGWLRRGLIDTRSVSGQDPGFSRVAVSNLFFRDGEARARRLAGTTWSQPEADTGPLVFDVRVELTVAADAVPAGEIVRAWLPFPQEYEHQQVITAEHRAAAAPMRAVYLEQRAVAGEAIVFTTNYRFERRGVRALPFDATKARLPVSRAFTRERAPHVIFSPSLSELTASIVGDETNPLRTARPLFDWCPDNPTYSFAREYSTIACIPAEVLQTRRGDCGQLTLFYMTLCRIRGIPARWQSGWVIQPGRENLHDWCEIRVDPWGWIPIDVNTAVETNHADELAAGERAAILDFGFGSLDCYRLVVNRDHGRALVPAKRSPRSDDVDFQRGEVEWGTPARNVYYDQFSYRLGAAIVR